MNIINNIVHSLTRSAVESEEQSTTNIAGQKLHRTHIEDLSAVGYELSEEHLRLVSGGMLNGTAGTCCDPGMCDDD